MPTRLSIRDLVPATAPMLSHFVLPVSSRIRFRAAVAVRYCAA
jgi:hypothetical protein